MYTSRSVNPPDDVPRATTSTLCLQLIGVYSTIRCTRMCTSTSCATLRGRSSGENGVDVTGCLCSGSRQGNADVSNSYFCVDSQVHIYRITKNRSRLRAHADPIGALHSTSTSTRSRLNTHSRYRDDFIGESQQRTKPTRATRTLPL